MIIYSKNSTDRKSKYRLITIIEENSGKKIVKKLPAHPSAKKHLMSHLNNYQKIKNYFKPLKVVSPKLLNGELIFPYIDGRNFQDEFNDLYFDGNFDEAHLILFEYKKILESLPLKKIELGENQVFKKIFGSTKGKYNCVKIGNLDLNLDNFIRKGKDIYLVDYEWVYDTPLPKDYLYFRALLYTFVSVKEILEYQVSKEFPVVKLLPNVLIPEVIYRNEFPKFRDQVKFYKFEMNFQKHIGLSRLLEGINKPMLIDKPIFVDPFARLESTDIISKQNNGELRELRIELKNIYNSKSWKTAMKLKKIKKSLPFIKKL